MTQEQKELLFKDLCARLPYGVKVRYSSYKEFITCTLHSITPVYDNVYLWSKNACFNLASISKIKPYLFPMSSMTDKQAKEIQEIIGDPNYACIMRKTGGLELWLDSIDTDPTIWLDTIFEVQDYLNKNKFDYRGLIKKGLAIDATGLDVYDFKHGDKIMILQEKIT